MKRICVLGSNSGRNAGDAAILSSIVLNLLKLRPDTRFEVPVPRKKDLTSRFDPAIVRPVPMMPWNLSLRFIGIPTLLSILRSDVVLITDGIIFDVKLFNPLFNFLILLVFVVPFAKLFRKKVVCLLVGIGPLHMKAGRLFTRFVCSMCDDIYVRETDSIDLLEQAGIPRDRVTLYADAAFVDEPAPPERITAVLAEKGIGTDAPVIGLNVNSYLDRWLTSSQGSIDSDAFVRELAAAVDLIIDQQKCKVAFVLTQVMDVTFAERVLAHVQKKADVVVFSNRQYSPEELMGVLGRMRFFIGMRLHSLILATAVDTPCIGLAYAPKVRHFMDLIRLPEYTVELATLKARDLADRVQSMADREDDLRRHVATRADELRTAAREGFEAFAETYIPS